jgi:hypothetical protein
LLANLFIHIAGNNKHSDAITYLKNKIAILESTAELRRLKKVKQEILAKEKGMARANSLGKKKAPDEKAKSLEHLLEICESKDKSSAQVKEDLIFLIGMAKNKRELLALLTEANDDDAPMDAAKRVKPFKISLFDSFNNEDKFAAEVLEPVRLRFLSAIMLLRHHTRY